VLWFPTGGGKTEAYLGLILVALFYDRLRGKLRGATAWMLFPLRMLSVQQLARISDVLYHADIVRHDEQIDGQPFSLGYLVGANNTPNRLVYANNWWPGLQAFASWAPEARNLRRLVGRCPQCEEPDSVCLEADLSASRLLHRCDSCGQRLEHLRQRRGDRALPAISDRVDRGQSDQLLHSTPSSPPLPTALAARARNMVGTRTPSAW